LQITGHDPTNGKWGFHDLGWGKLWIVPAKKKVPKENGFDPSFFTVFNGSKKRDKETKGNTQVVTFSNLQRQMRGMSPSL